MATHVAVSRISARCLSRRSLLGGIRTASSQAHNPSYPLTPSVAQLLHEHDIPSSEISKIPATGPKGRLLKGDVLSYVGAIASDYSSNLSSQIAELAHLDLSNIKVAPPPAAAASAPEPQPSPAPSPAEEQQTIPVAENIKVSLPISFTNLFNVQGRVENGIGVSLPVTTLVNRAAHLANIDLPVSRESYASRPHRMNNLYEEILSPNAPSSSRMTPTSTGSYFPVLESESEAADTKTVTRPAMQEDIIDVLSGKASPSPRAQEKTDSGLPEKSADEVLVFSLSVPKAEEGRAQEFLQRVRSYVEDKPDTLLLI